MGGGLRSSDRVPIIVALISLAGVVFGTLVGNWDKLFPDRPAAAGAVGDATLSPGAVAAQSEGASRPDVAGAWHDSDGYDYLFTQDGDAYGFVQLRNGSPIESGDGRLTGRSFRHAFRGQFGTGECSGAVSADGQQASGTCRSGANNWGFAVNR